MAEQFDPYHEWLAIPPKDQPPNHYRLLGLETFEDKPNVIENAADQRMAHLRTFQSGQHGPSSQRLLNEVATARLCLLNPDRKAAYDALLVSKDSVSSIEAAYDALLRNATDSAEPSFRENNISPTDLDFDAARGSASRNVRSRRESTATGYIYATIAAGTAGLVVILAIIAGIVNKGSEQETVAAGRKGDGSIRNPEADHRSDIVRQRRTPGTADFSQIVAGVKLLSGRGAIPGAMSADSSWTPIAFGDSDAYAVIDGKHQRPAIVVAARQFGAGRIVAMTQGYYSPPTPPEQNDCERFGENIFSWLNSTRTKVICVRQTRWSASGEIRAVDRLVAKRGYQKRIIGANAVLTTPGIRGCGVLLYDTQWEQIAPAETAAIENFVQMGGGLLMVGIGWSYLQYHPAEKDLARFPMNILGARFGLRFESGHVEDPVHNTGGPAEPLIRNFYPARVSMPKDVASHSSR